METYGFEEKLKKKIYYLENRKSILAKKKIYNKENSEHIKDYQRLYRNSHIDKVRKLNRDNMRTKDKTFLMLQRYKNICKKLNLKCEVDIDMWEKIMKYFDYECCYCKNETDLVLGFIIPYSRNGNMVYGNVVCCCKFHRYSKRNKLLDEWLQFDITVRTHPEKINKLYEYMRLGK